ncbi:hypothetical protein ACFWN2_20700 [Lentzea sp. NPDC058436]|uniref:hypothetical protein n=1 Tax=Lentzea sp. NPDC058436 TaxID=3346499 RepID=UPI00365AC176
MNTPAIHVRDPRKSYGTTVLLTTRHLGEAERLADRIAILHNGLVIANDTIVQVPADHLEGRGHSQATPSPSRSSPER